MDLRLKLIAVGVIALMIPGCVTMQQVKDKETAMQGMAQSEILSCMGAPDKRDNINSSEVWQYFKHSSDEQKQFKTPGFYNVTSFGDVGGSLDLMKSNVKSNYCKVSVIFNNGKVSQVTSSATKANDCEDLLKDCER